MSFDVLTLTPPNGARTRDRIIFPYPAGRTFEDYESTGAYLTINSGELTFRQSDEVFSLSYKSDGIHLHWNAGPLVPSGKVWTLRAPLTRDAEVAVGNFLGADRPSGFGWNFTLYPVNFYRAGRGYTTDFDPRAFVNPAIWSGPVYYVDYAGGLDTNNGTSISTPVKTITKATTLANAGGVPCRVMIKSAEYGRTEGPSGSGGATTPTVDIAYIAYGGRVTVHSGDPSGSLTWAQDATFTSCYSTTRANVARVVALATHDPIATDLTELTPVATPTLCNSTPGSWAQSGSTLYVHRSDNSAVSDANTRALLLVDNLVAGTKSLYLSGIDFQGGMGGCLKAISVASRNIVADNCTFKWSGSSANLFDAVRIDQMTGLAVFRRCVAAAAAKDGFNFHNTTGQVHALTINCEGRYNGRYTSTSNNGLTLHEVALGLDVNGYYHHNYGGNVRNVATSQHWLVGTVSEIDYGDKSLGGTFDGTGFAVQESAKMWLDSTESRGNVISLHAMDATSAIYTRSHIANDGQQIAVGTIAAY